jgi:hypothetical protein
MIINPPPPATAFPTDKHIEAAAKSLTAAEKKQIASVSAELDRLNSLAGSFQPERMGQPHPLDERIRAAEVALMENPTEDLALELHSLIVRRDQAKLTGGPICGAIGHKVRVVIDTMIPVAIGVIDKGEAAFLAEAEAHREATKNQTTFSAAAVDFDARIEATRAALAEKRRWISNENAAAHFLLLELALGVS